MKIKAAVLREYNKPLSLEELELEPPKEKKEPKKRPRRPSTLPFLKLPLWARAECFSRWPAERT